MIAIFGLGNVGDKYKYTRHNVGFMMLDLLASVYNLQFSTSKKLHSEIAKNEDVLLVKPLTMMNASGEAVSALSTYYMLRTADLYVVHDDLDLKLGEYKIQWDKGPKVHNGVNSIERLLGTSKFWRVRIGVDNRDPENRTPGEAYVLQSFTDKEMGVLQNVIKKSSEELINKING